MTRRIPPEVCDTDIEQAAYAQALDDAIDEQRIAWPDDRDHIEIVVLCPACGHDQDGHDPSNLPPYQCAIHGCGCSRIPDHLIVEPPQEGAA